VFQVGGTPDRPAGYHMIARAMAMHFSDSRGEAFPSLVTLAANCGMPISSSASESAPGPSIMGFEGEAEQLGVALPSYRQ
jgi:hypothetical protein